MLNPSIHSESLCSLGRCVFASFIFFMNISISFIGSPSGEPFPPTTPLPYHLLVKKKGVSLPSNLGYDWYSSGMNELPPHRSFSQLSTWQSCPQKYYLSKVAMVPEKPAVYLAAGSAVHSMLEWLNHELYRQQSTGD